MDFKSFLNSNYFTIDVADDNFKQLNLKEYIHIAKNNQNNYIDCILDVIINNNQKQNRIACPIEFDYEIYNVILQGFDDNKNYEILIYKDTILQTERLIKENVLDCFFNKMNIIFDESNILTCLNKLIHNIEIRTYTY